MIGNRDGGATVAAHSQIERQRAVQIILRRHRNHVYSSYIWSITGTNLFHYQYAHSVKYYSFLVFFFTHKSPSEC